MNKFLASLPSTNFRIFVGVMLAIAVVFYTMLAGVVEGMTGKDVLLDGDYLELLRNFVLVILAIDAAQFSVKRITNKPEMGNEEEGP